MEGLNENLENDLEVSREVRQMLKERQYEIDKSL